MQVGAKKARIKAWCLVRGPDGKPKFDDIFNIPKEFWDSLTDEDKRYIENERNTLSSNS
jgi:hypothetical protein